MFRYSKSIKFFALATSLAALPAIAHAEERSFEHQGVQYVYTKTVRDDRTVLTGTADHAPFRFVVRGGYVTGEYNYHPVNFSLREVKPSTDVPTQR